MEKKLKAAVFKHIKYGHEIVTDSIDHYEKDLDYIRISEIQVVVFSMLDQDYDALINRQKIAAATEARDKAQAELKKLVIDCGE